MGGARGYSSLVIFVVTSFSVELLLHPLQVYSKPTSKTESQDQTDHKSSTIPRRRSDLPKVQFEFLCDSYR